MPKTVKLKMQLEWIQRSYNSCCSLSIASL